MHNQHPQHPMQQKDRSVIKFISVLTVGIGIGLVLAYALMGEVTNMQRDETDKLLKQNYSEKMAEVAELGYKIGVRSFAAQMLSTGFVDQPISPDDDTMQFRFADGLTKEFRLPNFDLSEEN